MYGPDQGFDYAVRAASRSVTEAAVVAPQAVTTRKARTGPPAPSTGRWPGRNLRSVTPRKHGRLAPRGNSLGAVMNDLLIVGITIVIFATFFLLVRVVEHLER